MAAKSILDLVDVQFQDATNHTSITSTDTIGMVMPFYWGESDKTRVYTRTEFFEMYPESLPVGVTGITDTDIYSGYAQIKNAFSHGAGEVEIYRPSEGWKFQGITITNEGGVAAKAAALDGEKFDETKAVSISLKYAGFVPQSLAYGYDNVAFAVKFANSTDYTDGTMITVAVFGKKGNAYDTTPIEVFEGAADPNANIGGESIFLEDVVNGNSQIIDVRVTANVKIASPTETQLAYQYFDCATYAIAAPTVDATFKSGIVKGYDMFEDYESSVCTLLMTPFVSVKTKIVDEVLIDTFDSQIKNIAEYRKNCLAVVGYPIDYNSDYTKENVETYFSTHPGKGSKFVVAVQGCEYVTVFGQRFTLNCVGGYCGAMVNIAKEAHLNQIASGYVYGNYGGSLKKSLLSGKAIDLMEVGINSVFASKRGNIIWGTRTMYSRQSSYFGKINVMRVCSMLLKNIFPIAIETLHTDAASNPITRASLSTMLNSIIDTYIANQDLHADSYADCSDSINTDYLTKGGTVLNIILSLHFIGLVERVSIKIIATDTSVTAEFV